MKQLVILLFLFILSCTKTAPPAPAPTVKDVFTVPRNTVTNGSDISFNLKSAGVYTLTMTDTVTGNVVTRERFTGKLGTNDLKIYTKTLPSPYLYLILQDQSGTQIGKTTVIIN
jgi:hypothetical protein